MKISVCMGLYNGEPYIYEQLISILHQTRQPDEVILCDDGSSDHTVKQVKEFIRENRLQDRWKVLCNKENKGYPENYYYAMGLCTGDITFLSDQDDIWEQHKLEKMCKIMEDYPDAQVVCCKFGLVDAEGSDINTVMKPVKSTGTGAVRKVSIEDVFYKCEWPGMVLAYRQEWYLRHCKRWGRQKNRTIPHDFLICAWAAEEGGFLQIDEELAYHRRHDHNTGKEEHRIARLLNRDRKLQEIAIYNNILNSFANEKALQTQLGKIVLNQKQRVMQQRYQALGTGKVTKVISWAWRNRKEVRLATVVCDFLIVIKCG